MSSFACPNCRGFLPADAATCPGCGALFGQSADWKPVPRGSLGRPPRMMDWGDVLLSPVKALLSVVCLLLGIAVLFGGEWNWGRLLAALFFFALGAATWVMLFPSRVRMVLLGLLALSVGAAFVYMALPGWDATIAFPKDCSALRRPLACKVDNLLHAVGGPLLVRASWAALGVVCMVVGVQIIRGKVRNRFSA